MFDVVKGIFYVVRFGWPEPYFEGDQCGAMLLLMSLACCEWGRWGGRTTAYNRRGKTTDTADTDSGADDEDGPGDTNITKCTKCKSKLAKRTKGSGLKTDTIYCTTGPKSETFHKYDSCATSRAGKHEVTVLRACRVCKPVVS